MASLFPNPEDLTRTAQLLSAERETVPEITQYDLYFLRSVGARPEVMRQNGFGMVTEVRL
jgi:hypothetical protein